MPKTEKDRCNLSAEARKKVLHHFETRIQSEITHPETGYKVSWRRAIQLQIQSLARNIKGEEDEYIPYKVKL